MTTDLATRVQPLGEFTADAVTSLLASVSAAAPAIKYGVRAAVLGYATHDALGRPCRASGLIAAPVGADGERDVVAWLHGTSVNHNDVPSNPADLASKLLAALFASAGFFFVAPDYLGLGVEGEGRHPYLHATSAASASRDMLAAARDVATEALGVSSVAACAPHGLLPGCARRTRPPARPRSRRSRRVRRPRLRARLRSLQSLRRHGADRLPPTRREHLRIPRVPAGGVPRAVRHLRRTGRSGCAAVRSHRTTALRRPPHARRGHAGPALRAPASLISRDWWDAALGDPAHPFSAALRENGVDDFAPRAPTRLYVGSADEDVPSENAFEAARAFRERGSATVEIIELGPLDHEATAYAAFPQIRAWFEEVCAAAG